MAFVDTLKPPAKTLSPYTCHRSLLESSAIALWLLDLDINTTQRVGRCYGYRFKEFREQINFYKSDKINPYDSQLTVMKIQQRMEEVEAEAIALGYQKLTKNGKPTGIAIHMPGTVELVKKTLDKESEYRLLSGIAHSYLWATQQVGFKLIEIPDAEGRKIKAFQKHLHPAMFLFGIILAIPTFARVLWVMGKLYGWDIKEIENVLNQTFDDLGLNDNLRFWRQSITSN